MEEAALPPSVNPNNFPAKLWRLVNSPSFPSISWDSRGEGVLIDQPQFEGELLKDGTGDAASVFKTKNFSSVIRQLNLYGFHKVIGWAGAGVGLRPGPGPQAAGSNGGRSAWLLHHFQSPHFRRGRPDLLVNMKRLTKANKAKMVAGVGVTGSLSNRFQQPVATSLRGNAPSALSKASGPALITVGQFHQLYHQDNFFPYSYVSTSSQNHNILPTKTLAWTPASSATWRGSRGLFPGLETSPAGLQRFPTEVTYTLQPVASILPLHQGSQTVATSLPKSSSQTTPVQYSQACSPPAALQCCSPPAHIDPLTGCAGPAASMNTHSSLFQGPPMQSPYAAEFPPSSWQCNISDENKKTEVNLEAVFQIVDEMCASLRSETVMATSVESQCSTLQSNSGQPLLANSENSDTPSSLEEHQLKPLSCVASDTAVVMAVDQAVACSVSQHSEFLCATDTTAAAGSAAAEVGQESVTTQEGHEKQRQQPDPCPTQSSIMVGQEGLFSPEQENTSGECESNMSETEERQLTSGTELVNKSVEETDSCVKPRCRKRRHSSQNDKSDDLHLLVDVECKRAAFGRKEEESEKWVTSM